MKHAPALEHILSASELMENSLLRQIDMQFQDNLPCAICELLGYESVYFVVVATFYRNNLSPSSAGDDSMLI